jgi:hypothetical protein
MMLNNEQLATIVATALPGEQLREQRALPRQRIALSLTSSAQLHLQQFSNVTAANAAVAALRRLRGEIDLPLPLLRGSDTSGEVVGVPYLLMEPLIGEPLNQVLSQIGDEQLNNIGRRLGEVAYRIHRLACPAYGPLGSAETTSERDYVLARLASQLSIALSVGLLDHQEASELQSWFDEEFQPIGTQAALVCGGLAIEQLLVRSSGEGWVLSGVLGWEHALGWAPAWDHVQFLDSARSAACFALRVGYGNAYDQQTPRTYEQVREGILRPYRMVLALERAIAAQQAGDLNERERNRRMLGALLQIG